MVYNQLHGCHLECPLANIKMQLNTTVLQPKKMQYWQCQCGCSCRIIIMQNLMTDTYSGSDTSILDSHLDVEENPYYFFVSSNFIVDQWFTQ